VRTIRTSIPVWTLLVALVCRTYALSTEEIVKKDRSAVVEIVTQDKSGSTLATGTGFFISTDGELVTNRHVLEGAASTIAKTDQGSFFVCQGILAEPKDVDLAILKFEAKSVPFLELEPDSGYASVL
jgi:S1-C subfamily serine protease